MKEKEKKVRGLCGHFAEEGTEKCPKCGKLFMVYKSAHEASNGKEVAVPSPS